MKSIFDTYFSTIFMHIVLCTYFNKQNFLYQPYINMHQQRIHGLFDIKFLNKCFFWINVKYILILQWFFFSFQKLDRCTVCCMHRVGFHCHGHLTFFLLLKFFLKWHYYYHLAYIHKYIRNLSLLKRDCYAIILLLDYGLESRPLDNRIIRLVIFETWPEEFWLVFSYPTPK